MSTAEAQTSKIKQWFNAFDEELSHYAVLVRLEVLTGVSKVYFVSSVVGVFALMVFLNYAGSLLSNLLGWVYPGRCVFGFLHLVEHASDYLLHWMPFYFLAKSIFLVWLFHDYFRGAETIYTKFLKAALTQATPFIDSYVGRAKEVVTIASDELKKK